MAKVRDFLIDSDPIGVAQEFLHFREVIFNGFGTKLPVYEIGNIFHRARTVAGIHSDEVLEALRMEPL